ncbi:MAG: metal ABC transporter permease, partial [Dysgonamonadaceae bacterium]|nr:metal ABC transporter permease [Dysgonamonadaceae bacterium]
MEILHYTFFQNALWGSLFISIACGMVGTYVVARRLVFISGGITHASFGGLGLGFYLGINPFLMALGFAALSAFGVEWVSKSHQVREDSAIAAIWSLGMAIGVVFIVLTPGYAPNLSSYLFGNILTVSKQDILWAGVFALLLCVIFTFIYREIVYSAFDRDFALTQGVPVKAIEYLMILSISITIVLSIRLAGIMLLMSLLTVPQMTMNLFTASFKRMVLGSIIHGFLACVTGLFLSYFFRIPSGAFIIIVLIVSFLLAKGVLFL